MELDLGLDVPLDDGFTIEAALLEIHSGGMSACLGERERETTTCVYFYGVWERGERVVC